MIGQKKRKYRRIIYVLLFLCAVVVVFDLVMALLAFRERSATTENPWLVSTQVLDAGAAPQDCTAILVHGYVGSPFDLKPLAEALSQRGCRVVIPLMPGQTRATFAYDRAAYTPTFYIEWLRDIIEEETRRTGQRPHLIGFSMGGTLATIVASDDTVQKVVLIAPFFSLTYANDLVSSAAKSAKWVIPLVPKIVRGMINEPVGYNEYTPGTYLTSLGAFEQLQKLARIARQQAPRISNPILVLASPNDRVASFTDTSELFKRKENAEPRAFPRSNHILLYDYDSDAIIEEVVAFIAEK